MGPYSFYLISAVMMAVFLGITWVVTSVFHLGGNAEMIIRVVLMAVVMIIFGAFIGLRARREKKKADAAARERGETVSGVREIDSFVKDAETRLAQSALGKETKLSDLPVFFLVGESSSAKTSVFVHSGVEPDLLAGQVYQDNTIVSTRPVNIWLAQRSVFVEPGGVLIEDAGRWAMLVKRMSPSRRRIFRGKPQAPRGAIVCVDAESFLRPDAGEALTLSARNLRTRLGEISQVLGIRLPVYVLFSKLDRLGYFTDFVSNLTDEEATQVLGVTLPLISDREQGGVYAEEESRRLTAAFDGLFRALCDKRPPYLAREHDPGKLPPVYEFPREFRKMRNSAVRFLVDLGRPSQLRANPFLRGFYFSGVRPVVVSEAAPAARAAAPPVRRAATGFFTERRPADDPIADPVRSRRIPQWVFLGHLFSDVVLRDRAAMGASGHSLRTELVRRVLAASAAGLCVLWSIGMTVSYFRNRALENRLATAVHDISRAERVRGQNELASPDSLEKLETLRQTVADLSDYEQNGAPWSMRWGLYVGHDLYPSARSLYFDNFRQVLFGETQLALLELLRKLPDRPGPSDKYSPTYDTLKAYLITTSNPEKSSREFLTPQLMEKWLSGRDAGPERTDLAQRQFDFYADQLLIRDPFSKDTESNSVERARFYLAQFNAFDSIYQTIISEASQPKDVVNFNKKNFPGSEKFVINDKDVAGAFTVNGWKLVNAAIDRYQQGNGGEKWVLGDRNYASINPAQLGPLLRERYHQDFIANWRQYLANSSISAYNGLSDAAGKLKQLSSSQSYLMKLFCLASVNIAAGTDVSITAQYQPIAFVTPATCMDQFVQGNSTTYIDALLALYNAINRVVTAGGGPPDPALVQSTIDAASHALDTTVQIAQNFHNAGDGEVGRMVEKLMQDPITHAQALLGRLGPAQINSEAGRLCDPFMKLMKKYPFDTGATQDATIDELNAIFQPPGGKVPAFYESTLKNYVDKQGNTYVQKPGSKIRITDKFLTFFNRAMAFSGALYKAPGQPPGIAYSMRVLPFEGLKTITLSLDGQVLKSGPAGGPSQDFTWPGTTVQKEHLSYNMGGVEAASVSYDGLWAAFRFFGDADQFTPSGSNYQLAWWLRSGQGRQISTFENGHRITFPFLLDLKGAPPIFQKGYLAGLASCPTGAAQ